MAVWRTNDLYVSPRRMSNGHQISTPRTVKSPTPRGLRRISTVGPGAAAVCTHTATGASTPPASEEKPSTDGVRLSLFLPRTGRLTAKALLGSLQSLIASRRDSAGDHRVSRGLRTSFSLPRRFQQVASVRAGAGQQSAAGAGSRSPGPSAAGSFPGVSEASSAASATCSVTPSSPEQEDTTAALPGDRAAAMQHVTALSSTSPTAALQTDIGSAVAGASCNAKSSPPEGLLRRTGSLRRPSTDSAFDAAEALALPSEPALALQLQLTQPSRPAVRAGPKQHADLLLQRPQSDTGLPVTPRCEDSSAPAVQAGATAAPAAASATAFASPTFLNDGRSGCVGSPGISAADGSPSLPCPAAYVLHRGGINRPASSSSTMCGPRQRRLSGLHTPPGQHHTAVPALPKAEWLSTGGAMRAFGGAVNSNSTPVPAAAEPTSAAALAAPLSPRGAAAVFVHVTATNAAVMASLSSDKSQVAAAAACALTSDGGSVAGRTTIGGGDGGGAAITSHRRAQVVSGGTGAAGSSPASVCGSPRPKASANGRALQRSAASVVATRQSAARAYASVGGGGGGGGGARTVSSGSSSLAGDLYRADGALPRYLQPTASFAAKQGRK
ncbi:hypothetical protein HYH02_001077 [Chlamydomonas schloesseri]|uniref:Uncharacterized protein n=1 Tax=Chlamydomonas schloesseri TaxID=2026947 RepID=A0A835WWS4_9CHLO|nr:hypothetical protein HYH02_001077 [Chlamydomonas schloesseri]|eukprot:KAG2454036.1 hypothetical protein HYH02_001077 [Chlamydomonas schloesseri]